ncbi:MAG: KamA family radical SAM protein [bacterium]
MTIWKDVTEDEWNDWRWQLKHAIRSWRQLGEALPLTPEELRYAREVGDVYPILISPYYLSLIHPDDPNDPVRAQAVPVLEELTEGQELDEDPLDEETDSPVAGLTHRYPDRVLMFTTDFCSTYCRHCTRKRAFRVDIPRPKLPDIDEMIHYVREHEEVKDVILSGGDPLTLSHMKLEYILRKLREIPHLDMIRLGSRVPVTLPQRLYDKQLLAMLDKYGPIWNNTHFNHPNEVTLDAAKAVDNLLHAGIPVNNHTVLMKGINDDVDTMRTLCRKLLQIKCRPYYLFHCDPVRGVAHFRTSVWKGVEIIEGLRGHISGLGVPTYVIDAPGGGGKIPIMPNYVLSMNDESLIVRNYEGVIVKYYPFGSPGKHPKKNGRNGNGNGDARPGVVHWEKVGVSRLLESDETSLARATSPRLQRRKKTPPKVWHLDGLKRVVPKDE